MVCGMPLIRARESGEPVLSERALQRRLKRQVMKQTQQFFAVTAVGFEAELQSEVEGLPDVVVLGQEPGGITFEGSLDTMYHANLWLRSAHRVLWRIDTFLAQSYPMLFDHAKHIAWELFLGFNSSYCLRVSAKASRLRHQKNIAATLQAAITAALKPLGLAPANREEAALEIHLRLFQDRCTLSINTSGDHLHKRGYRPLAVRAPIRETLAASIVQRLGVEAPVVIDPMCGTGTLLIEAALLARNRAPGLLRAFAFEALPVFQESKWQRYKQEASGAEREVKTEFIGLDIDPEAIRLAKLGAAVAGVSDIMRFELADARTWYYRGTRAGKLLTNVPYGARLKVEGRLKQLLEDFARHLGTAYPGWQIAVVTKQNDWLQSRLEGVSAQAFNNGGLSVWLITGKIRAA